MNPEEIDLAALTERLAKQSPSSPIGGYLVGKTWFRNAVAADLRCSELEAERIVDTLVMRGFLVPSSDPRSTSEPIVWRIASSTS